RTPGTGLNERAARPTLRLAFKSCLVCPASGPQRLIMACRMSANNDRKRCSNQLALIYQFVGNGARAALDARAPAERADGRGEEVARWGSPRSSERRETGRLPFASAASVSTTQGARCSASTEARSV